ncbi:hypothetical protein C8J57DRAFT_1270288 [Mycena rebaudengoi]|nr:hypothetical protein C8J57DRAFT_1270288 [Mycena rebaudengoi]
MSSNSSAPGSNQQKYEEKRRKQRNDTVTFPVDTTGWSPEFRASTDAFMRNAGHFPPNGMVSLEAPTGPLDVRMANMGGPPASSRHHKHDSSGGQRGGGYPPPSPYIPTPSAPYGGSATVPRSSGHVSSGRMNNFPPELGGRSSRDPGMQMSAPPPNQYPQSGYQTAPYGSNQNVPRSPDRVTGQRINLAMAVRDRAAQIRDASKPVSNGNNADPRYPNGRGY